MGFAIGYAVFLCILACFTLYIAIRALMKKERFGYALGATCLLTFFLTACYLASALANNQRIANITANLYFGGVSLVLALFVGINTRFCKRPYGKFQKIALIIADIYALYEFVMFIVNIHFGFAVKIVPTDYGTAPWFHYEMHTLFYMHLAYSYIIIGIVFVQLLFIILKTPKGYRRQYGYVMTALAFVIAINAAFLFIPSDFALTRFDISLPGYYFLILMIYWSYFYYNRTGMISKFKEFIIDNVDEGYVLFNYEQKMSLCNEKARKMLVGISLTDQMEMKPFIKRVGLDPKKKITENPIAAQIMLRNGEERKSLRLTAVAIFNARKQPIGYLFTLGETEYESDILTSFLSYNVFTTRAKSKPNWFGSDRALSIIDIDNLGMINAEEGYASGNEAIQDLSNKMRKYFPIRHSEFVRGKEACLMAFTEGLCEEDAMEICKTIANDFKYPVEYAVTMVKEDEPLLEAVDRANDSLNTRKVMDGNSHRSGSLNSLIKALQEVDSDTSEHVKRTQIMAERLGKKLGLSQVDLANLLLLAVLHDIGKISIPLEILNKPTTLSEDEWKVLRAHTVKGYNIAMASPMLKGIAEDILHHHERWDGKGYPGGLKGTEIPLLSRIVAVVDSYDAMVSDRIYRRAMSKGAAIQELIRCSGTQFDPDIVKAFVEVLEADKEVYRSSVKTEKTAVSPEDVMPENKNISALSYTKYTLANSNDIVYADKRFEELTGYNTKDLENGLTQIDLIPLEDRLAYSRAVREQLGKSNFAVLEHRIRKKDGTVIYVFCYGKKYYDSAVREFRDEIIAFDIGNSNVMKNIVESEETIEGK